MTYKKVMENGDMAIYDTNEVLDSAYLPIPETDDDPGTETDDGYED